MEGFGCETILYLVGKTIGNNELGVKSFEQFYSFLTLARRIRCEGNNGDFPAVAQQMDYLKHMLKENVGDLALC